MNDAHVPVLVDEVLAGLAVRPNGFYVDATFGRGGHSAAIVAQLGPEGRLLALDRDPEAIEAGKQRFAGENRVTLVHARFATIDEVVAEHGKGRGVDGVLLDVGVSSPQLDDARRGFSFAADGPLDMRMDPTRGMSAAQWLATASERDIGAVIRQFGEERHARRIARAIVEARRGAPLASTGQLADLVSAAVPRSRERIHPATRTFQAIRIFINGELDELAAVLPKCIDVLRLGGRCAVISFHSLEDRIVKRFFRRLSRVDPAFAGLPVIPDEAQPRLRLVGKRVRAGEAEIAANPRARSATLRVAERVL